MLKLNDDRLLCPNCGGDHVHLDDVFVGGRPRQDEDVVNVHIDEKGAVRRGSEVDLPLDPQRRHVFSLGGWCEICSARFAFSFEQHKGNTLVSVQKAEWTSLLEG